LLFLNSDGIYELEGSLAELKLPTSLAHAIRQMLGPVFSPTQERSQIPVLCGAYRNLPLYLLVECILYQVLMNYAK
jgi:hypothetical protein